MRSRDRLIETSRLVIRCAFFANRVFLLAVVVGLALSWVFPAQFALLLSRTGHDADLSPTIHGLRLLMLVGVVMGLATDRLLSALGQLVATARAGDPFVAANARRLQAIGWSLLVLQLLDIPDALLTRFFPGLGSAAPVGDVSVGGWLAVLMVFVLARVFAAGAVMRDELEATV